MQEPLVSILIPFKNTFSFLSECLNSILNQTYTNWELIIVDDFSTDKSYELVTKYAKTEKRITLLKNNNSGIINALRLALHHSKGTLITRMDSDDVMHKEKIEILTKNLLLSGKKHIATGLVRYFSSNGIREGYKKYEEWLNHLTIKGTNYSDIYKECVIPSPCWMVYKDDLIACNAFNSNRYPEDYDLTFRFYECQLKVIPCNKVLHYWRDYQMRASRTDSNYAQNSFLELKTHYFLKLHYNPTKQLIIWGAGKKGKTLAKLLIKENISFEWICDNPKKIGKHIYNKLLKPFTYIKTIKNSQSIVTVANTKEQLVIRNYCLQQNKQQMVDYFFFC